MCELEPRCDFTLFNSDQSEQTVAVLVHPDRWIFDEAIVHKGVSRTRLHTLSVGHLL